MTPESHAGAATLPQLAAADAPSPASTPACEPDDDPWLTAADLRARLPVADDDAEWHARDEHGSFGAEPDDDAGWQSRDGHDSYVLALQVANGKVEHPGKSDDGDGVMADALRERMADIEATIAEVTSAGDTSLATQLTVRSLEARRDDLKGSLADLEIPAHLRIGTPENDAIRRGPRQTAGAGT